MIFYFAHGLAKANRALGKPQFGCDAGLCQNFERIKGDLTQPFRLRIALPHLCDGLEPNCSFCCKIKLKYIQKLN